MPRNPVDAPAGKSRKGSKMEYLPRIDLHTHSNYSDGRATISDIVREAEKKKLRLLAISDHFDPNDPKVTRRGLTMVSLGPYVDDINQARDDTKNVKILASIEANIIASPDNSAYLSLPMDIDWKSLKERGVDFVQAGVHYIKHPIVEQISEETWKTSKVRKRVPPEILNVEYWERYKLALLKTIENPMVSIITHVEGYLPMPPFEIYISNIIGLDRKREIEKSIVTKFFDEEWKRTIIEKASASGKAFELHVPTRTPTQDFIRLCLKEGAKLSIGTDAHSLGQVGDVVWAIRLLNRLGAKRKDIIFNELID